MANGDGPRDHPAIAHLNLWPLGNPGRPYPLVAASLLFIGEGTGSSGGVRVPEGMPPEILPNFGDPFFRAYDKATGEVVWEVELPAGTPPAPMTYMHEGKQFVVVAIGGTDDGPARFVAFSLGTP